MQYMTEAKLTEQVVPFYETSAPTQRASAEMQYRIKRIGARPLIFTGAELGMAMSFAPDMAWWYEFNLFRSTQGFVLTVKRFYQSEDETDYCRAWEFDNLDAAMTALEKYDAAQDVKAERFIPSPSASAAEFAACAMQLRAEISEARAHFASLVGEFLHELDAEM
ncbi:MAG TPA: hypothetical protein DD444_01335 [Citreicella sp.]|jgi:ABC-type branched-subunit amino acid transport system substrate-binding protein|nr:hypothetical protein [Citreicella sp.]